MKFFVQDLQSPPISFDCFRSVIFFEISIRLLHFLSFAYIQVSRLLPRRFCFRVDPSTLLSFHPLVTSFLLFSFSSLPTSRSICLFFQRISQPTRLKSWTISSVMARIDLIDADRPRLIRLRLLCKRKANKFPTVVFLPASKLLLYFSGRRVFATTAMWFRGFI